MINSKLYLLIFIIFNIYTNNCQVTKKDKVLSIGIERCNTKADCPSHSKGCIYNYCYYKYYCLNEECISSTNTTFFYTEEKKKGVIVDSCTQEAINMKKCSTPVCNTDTDCFSNLCVNNVCMSNEDLTVIKCSNDYVDGIPKMKCKRNSFEKCEKDDDCYSNYCTKEKFCNNQENNNKKRKGVALFLLLAIGGFSSIILTLIIIYSIVMYCKRDKLEKIENEEDTANLTINIKEDNISENKK